MESSVTFSANDIHDKPQKLVNEFFTVQEEQKDWQKKLVSCEIHIDQQLNGEDIKPPREIQTMMEYIDLEKGVKNAGSCSSYLYLLNTFLSSHKSSPSIITDLIKKVDRQAIAAIAHKIKGAAATVSIEKLAREAEYLGRLAKSGDSDYFIIDTGINFARNLSQVLITIETEFPKTGWFWKINENSRSEGSLSLLRYELEQLIEAADSYDHRKIAEVLKRLKINSYNSYITESLQEIEKLAGHFSFTQCAHKCKQLLNKVVLKEPV